MQHRSQILLILTAVVATSVVNAQTSTTQSGMGTQGTTQGSQSSMQMGGQQSSSQTRNPADDITAVAPPFDVDDVLRMHRVGLQDEVIINALQSRYHPLILTAAELRKLRSHGVSELVICAIGDPFGGSCKTTDAPPMVQKQEATVAAGEKSKPASSKDAGTNSANSTAGGTYRTVFPDRASGTTLAATTTPTKTAPTQSSTGKNGTANKLAGQKPAITASGTEQNLAAEAAAQIALASANPTAPGVYRQISGKLWAPVEYEPVVWKHGLKCPKKKVEGDLAGEVSSSSSMPDDSNYLIITPEGVSIVEYQLLRARSVDHYRKIYATADGEAFGGEPNSNVLSFSPKYLGPRRWLVSLQGMPAGDYGFLPPSIDQLHSTTGLASKVFTFHIL